MEMEWKWGNFGIYFADLQCQLDEFDDTDQLMWTDRDIDVDRQNGDVSFSTRTSTMTMM